MRIAFASCAFSRVCPSQPVWTHIAQQAPDHLVLLGDSTYFDLAGGPAPQAMSDDEFAQHLFLLYSEAIAQPELAALVSGLASGSVHAIWDDHDFLWNDANGAEERVVHGEKIRLSTAFLEAFRAALAAGLAAGSFPNAYNDALFWDLNQPPLTTPSKQLDAELWLHLSDGRTHRTRTWLLEESKRTIFGPAQRDAFTQAITAEPRALHLWASGSTVAGYQRYTRDLEWLKGLAAGQRMLMLSGDIHRNELDAFYTGGWPLHEATSSGAAVRDAVLAGAERQNHGLLDIDVQSVTISLYKRGQLEQQRVLSRLTWLPV
jgi:alkaline phosphatase D